MRSKVSAAITARRILAFTGVVILAYVLWIGPERFFMESLGTWILSPIIYTRLLPWPASGWLISSLVDHPLLGYALVAVPVLLLGLAFLCGVYSFFRRSRLFALLSLLIVSGVITTYHHLQPMGVTLILD